VKGGGKVEFNSTASKDRHYICEIGRIFWGDNKQCYSADAVYIKVLSLCLKKEIAEFIDRLTTLEHKVSKLEQKLSVLHII